ncbi:Tn3 family transposase [Streptomyces sp. NPDC005989]|uniref:Tn3 family transposase n=1 Tax=Streptomyces sp. NPDC005989 TaxID=3156727 RepID=UPI003409C876
MNFSSGPRLANSCPDLPLADQTPHCGPTSKFREHVNTLLLQDILSEEKWQKRLTDADRRALSPLFWTHVNPYGRFELVMHSHFALGLVPASASVPGPRTFPTAAAVPRR